MDNPFREMSFAQQQLTNTGPRIADHDQGHRSPKRRHHRKMGIDIRAERFLLLITITIHRHSRWFFICGHSPRIQAAPSQAHRRSATCVSYYLLPVNGLSLALPNIVICSPILSSSNWCLMYSAIAFVFFPTVST